MATTKTYETPTFETLRPSEKSAAEDEYDGTHEEVKAERQVNKSSFIDLNDDNVIYQSNNKKALSPIQLSTQIHTAGQGHNGKIEAVTNTSARHRHTFQQSEQGRPHSASGDYSAVTATSSNSASASSASNIQVEMRKVATSMINLRPAASRANKAPKLRSNNPINIIKSSPAENVNFKKVLETSPFTYKKDRLLSKQIDKIFADGIHAEDPVEECSVRYSAYCLSLGLMPSFIKEHQTPLYNNLLKVSRERNENHKKRMDAFKAEHGPSKRLPLDNCCEEQTPMCRVIRQIKKDVPRTSSTFDDSKFDLPIQSGTNPIFNLLAAFAEHDKHLGYTQGMNFLIAIIFVAVQDEVLAFSVLQRLMEARSDAILINSGLPDTLKVPVDSLKKAPEWRFVYTDGMRKLNVLVKEIRYWLQENKRMLYVHFESRKIVLEALLSNPFLSLFSNVIPNRHALKVLDRFIHFGQKSLLQIVKNILTTQQDKLLRISDQFELQQYLSRQIYMDAIIEGNFFNELSCQHAVLQTFTADRTSTHRLKKTMSFIRTNSFGTSHIMAIKSPEDGEEEGENKPQQK